MASNLLILLSTTLFISFQVLVCLANQCSRPKDGVLVSHEGREGSGSRSVGFYPPGLACRISITAPATSQVVRLKFNRFSFPSDLTCTKAYVKVYTSYPETFELFCGDHEPDSIPVIQGLSQKMIVEVRTPKRSEIRAVGGLGSGFSAEYQFVSGLCEDQGDYRCRQKWDCISSAYQCDGEPNCPGGDDERLPKCGLRSLLNKPLAEEKHTSGDSNCGSPLVQKGLRGSFQSINYPSAYTSNLYCRWTITVPRGKLIRISFDSKFDLEHISLRPIMECWDAVWIYSVSPSSEYIDEVALLCGPEAPKSLVVQSNKAQVEFMSDSRVEKPGFRLHWSAVSDHSNSGESGVSTSTSPTPSRPSAPSNGVTDACKGEGPLLLLEESGKITSPRYKRSRYGRYPNNADCYWQIEGLPGASIEVAFRDFRIEYSGRCYKDKLEIYEGIEDDSNLLGRYCGSRWPNRITSSKNILTFHFKSNHRWSYRGFSAEYKIIGGVYETSPITTTIRTTTTSTTPKPTTTTTRYTTTTTQFSHPHSPLNCGRPSILPAMGNTRIVGGMESIPHSWPWQVSLLFFGRHTCGGSLISERYVIGAGHCFKGFMNETSSWEAVLGSHRTATTDNGQLTMKISRIITHPQYKPNTGTFKHDHDIVILELSSSVRFSRTVSPICLTGRHTALPSGNCYVTGFGKEKESGVGTSPSLKQAMVPIIPLPQCKTSKGYLPKLTDNMICAGYTDGGHDSCQGDSGGPLVCPDLEAGVWRLHGIVSWGHGCAKPNQPGVYVNVRNYRDYIQRITGVLS